MITARSCSVALAIGVLLPFVVAAQSPCRASDAATRARVARISKLMSRTEPEAVIQRARYRLPVVADTAIVLVTDSLTCARAATAYNASLATRLQRPGRNAYVIRLGSTRFVVWDLPTTDGVYDPLEVVAVLDEGFNLLSFFAAVGSDAL